MGLILKLMELYSRVQAVAAVQDTLPIIAGRLKALSAVHKDVTLSATTLHQIEQQQEALNEGILSHDEALDLARRAIKDALDGSSSKLAELSVRVARLEGHQTESK